MHGIVDGIFDLAWAWMVAGLALAAIEILVPGIFLIWVGLGAFLVGLVLTLLPGLSLEWQLLVFAACMGASLIFGFFLQRRALGRSDAPSLNRELESMVGKRYRAITRFEAGRGRIAVADTSFAALSDDVIANGEFVEVIGIEAGKPKVARAKAGAVPR